ncbi:hypothetical protein AB0E08_28295 [Streptomyces sp. NPDC048281]
MADAAVIGGADEEGDEVPKAFVVPASGRILRCELRDREAGRS